MWPRNRIDGRSMPKEAAIYLTFWPLNIFEINKIIEILMYYVLCNFCWFYSLAVVWSLHYECTLISDSWGRLT